MAPCCQVLLRAKASADPIDDYGKKAEWLSGGPQSLLRACSDLIRTSRAQSSGRRIET